MKVTCNKCSYKTTENIQLESDTIKIDDGFEEVKQGKKTIRVPIWHFHKFLRVRDKNGQIVYFHCPTCLADCVQCHRKLPSNRGKTYNVSNHIILSKGT